MHLSSVFAFKVVEELKIDSLLGARCEPNTFDGERCLYAALTQKIKKMLKEYKAITSECMRRDQYQEFLRRLVTITGTGTSQQQSFFCSCICIHILNVKIKFFKLSSCHVLQAAMGNCLPTNFVGVYL